MNAHVIPFQTRKPRFKHYVSLKGETGRRVYYRPERFKGRILFPDALPKVTINGQPVTLFDLSMTGLAAVSRQLTDLAVGDQVEVCISHCDHELYRHPARIVRVEPTVLGVKIGLSLFQKSIRLPELLEGYASAALQQKLTHFDDNQADLQKIPVAYKELCSDLLFLLRRYRSILEDFETTNRANGTWSDETEKQMLACCLKAALPAWQRLWATGNEIVEALPKDDAVFKALKQFTEEVITPEFMDGPVWHRSYAKPFGYPGDFLIMKALYDASCEGHTTAGKFLHLLGIDMGVFVPNRMEISRKIIAELIADAGQDRPVRITNLGCGLAREISTLKTAGYTSGEAIVTLIDQDDRALDAAMQECAAQLDHTGIKPVFLNVSMTQIVSGAEAFVDLPPQDMIYSLGILDYIVEKRAKALLRRLYDKLLPNGKLVIANMYAGKESTFWPLEFIFDWNLIYRTEKDMLALVEGLPAASVETIIEPSGRVVMLVLQKP